MEIMSFHGYGYGYGYGSFLIIVLSAQLLYRQQDPFGVCEEKKIGSQAHSSIVDYLILIHRKEDICINMKDPIILIKCLWNSNSVCMQSLNI